MTLTLHGLEVRRGAFRVGPVDARFPPGVWRLVGPNGVGKTTLLRAVAGDLPASAGEARLDGRPLADPAVRRALGYAPVEPELPDFLCVDEAWRMMAALRGGDPAPNEARRDALGLPGSTRLHRCSAGMRRKADLLGAFAGEPSLLLLDEPFASLDDASVARIAGWLDGWRRERVIVLVHHGVCPLPVDGALDLGAAEGRTP